MNAEQRFAADSEQDQRKNPADGLVPVLNEYHKRRVRLTFQHVDSILKDVEQILADPKRKSPFSQYSSDLIPNQRKITQRYVARVRKAIAQIMKENAIPFARARCGERWAARAALLSASISIEELTPDRLQGYRNVSPKGADLLENIRSALGALLADLQKYLEQL